MNKKPVSALKQSRIDSGRTLDEQATFLGVSRETVLRWEKRLPASRLIEVSEKTGIPRERLLPELYETAA